MVGQPHLVVLGVEDAVDEGDEVLLVAAQVGAVAAGGDSVEYDQVLGVEAQRHCSVQTFGQIVHLLLYIYFPGLISDIVICYLRWRVIG